MGIIKNDSSGIINSPTQLAAAMKELRQFYSQTGRADLVVQSFSKTYDNPVSTENMTTPEFIDYHESQTEVSISHEIVENLMFTLLDNTEAAYFTKDLIINTKLRSRFEVNGKKDASSGLSVDEFAGIENFVKIVFEPEAETFSLSKKELDAMTFYVTKSSKNPYKTTDGEEKGESSASIRQLIMGGNSDNGGKYPPGAFSINENPLNPDRFTSPTLSAFIFPNQRMSPAARGTGAVSLFANAIPTLEMSRAVPYIDIKVITPNLSGKTAGSKRVSLLRFLGMEGGDSTNMEDAVPQSLLAGDFTLVQAGATGRAPSEGASGDLQRVSLAPVVAGMELFTAPQTMVNPNRDDNGMTTTLDTMVPFMTLNSLKISIPALGVAALSNKKATLKFTLHDRSRMADIAPLIDISVFSQSYMSITWGWSHPDGGEGSDNSYAKLINSMRSTSLFNIQKSEWSIANDGQVSITIDLASRGGQESKSFPIGTGDVMPSSPFKQMIVHHLAEILVRAEGESEERLAKLGKDSLGIGQKAHKKELEEIRRNIKLSSDQARSSSSVVSREIFDRLMRYLRPTGDPDAVVGVKEFYEIMTELVGDPLDPKSKGAISTGNASLASAVKKKSAQLLNTPDPFYPLSTNTHMENSLATGGETTLVSLGKIIMSFFGAPLAASGRFDEVQVLFYRFNDNAGAARELPSIASFLVKPHTFQRDLNRFMDGQPQMSVYSFFGQVIQPILSDMWNENYGLTQIGNEELDSSGDDKDQKPTLEVSDKLTARLTEIYQSGQPTKPVFKTPDLEFLLEALPAYVATDDKKNPTFIVDESKTILKVHIFDRHSTPSVDELFLLNVLNKSEVASEIKTQGSADNLEATSQQGGGSTAQGDRRGTLKKAIANDQIAQSAEGTREAENSKFRTFISKASSKDIKELIKSSMPSLTYGLGFSALNTFNLGSTTTGTPATVMLLNAYTRNNQNPDPTKGKGETSSFEDVTVIPASATMTMLGCPLIEYGQEFFIDLGTGTTADNIYTVMGLDHTLSPGEFNTSVTLGFRSNAMMDTFRGMVESAVAGTKKLSDEEKENQR